MKPSFISGNHVELLETGGAYFPALLAAIDAASAEIYLQTYIFADDETGRSVAAALARAARRGVVVRILVDGFGAREFPARLGSGLIADGAEVLVYRAEIGRLRLRRHRLRRLHSKIVVVDGRTAFVGGINIVNDWEPGEIAADAAPRRDYAVRIEGPLLEQIHATVRRVWQVVRWAGLGRRYPGPPHREPDDTRRGDMQAAFVIRDNLRHRRDIERAYIDAIRGARREVVLANAYFLPGRRFRHALADAARRGVAVTVLLQGRTDYRLLHHATQALYGALLGCGVRIVEYHPSLLHAKVAVIDGQWSTVGSSNIDPFSLLLAREANVMVRNELFAATLAASLARAIADGGREVRHDEWRQAALPVRFGRWLAYGLVRLIMGVAGYGGSDYRG
jgi:cardiolipin synthase